MARTLPILPREQADSGRFLKTNVHLVPTIDCKSTESSDSEWAGLADDILDVEVSDVAKVQVFSRCPVRVTAIHAACLRAMSQCDYVSSSRTQGWDVELHIVWHSTYNVPAAYIRPSFAGTPRRPSDSVPCTLLFYLCICVVCCVDGSGPVDHAAVAQYFIGAMCAHPAGGDASTLSEKWTYISQEVHRCAVGQAALAARCVSLSCVVPCPRRSTQ